MASSRQRGESVSAVWPLIDVSEQNFCLEGRLEAAMNSTRSADLATPPVAMRLHAHASTCPWHSPGSIIIQVAGRSSGHANLKLGLDANHFVRNSQENFPFLRLLAKFDKVKWRSERVLLLFGPLVPVHCTLYILACLPGLLQWSTALEICVELSFTEANPW